MRSVGVKKLIGGEGEGGKKGRGSESQVGPTIVTKRRGEQTHINLNMLPKDHRDITDPHRIATLTHFNDYLLERIRSGEPLNDRERKFFRQIRQQLFELFKNFCGEDYKDWADYIFNIIHNLDTILGEEQKTPDQIEKARRWFHKLFRKKY